MHKGKMVGDPAPSGKGGLKTVGKSTATSKLLAKCGVSKHSDAYGRKK